MSTEYIIGVPCTNIKLISINRLLSRTLKFNIYQKNEWITLVSIEKSNQNSTKIYNKLIFN